MIQAFIPEHCKNNGQDRYLQGMAYTDKVQIHYFNSEDEEKLKNYQTVFESDEPIIVAGVMPEVCLYFKGNVYYCYTSPFGQAELNSYQDWYHGGELGILKVIQQGIGMGQIKGCVTPSKSIADTLDFIYLPGVLNTNNLPKIDIMEDRANYGFLGNNERKHRNQYNQLYAIDKLEPKEFIVLNKKPNSIYLNKNLGLKLVGKLSNEDYFKEISSHRLNFTCSFSESFSYQVLEYCFAGVPSIVSPCIDWYPFKECVVKNIDNVQDIYKEAQDILSNKEFYEGISRKLPLWAQKFNEDQAELLSSKLELL